MTHNKSIEISELISEKRNINQVLSDYSNSNNNPKEFVEFYGIIDGYKHQKMYLVGDDYNIKCNINSDSYSRFKGDIYNMFVKRDKPTYIVLKGIPYFCGFTYKLSVKQVEIIDIF